MANPKRLLSLDILRGITIAGMILVNNPGTWSSIYAPLRHAQWHGLTPTDLIFPFFMFIMGVSTYFSLRRYEFKLSWPAIYKILRRSVVIFLIGWAVAWTSLFWRGLNHNGLSVWEAMNCFDSIRFLGVLPRLAICYCITALLALCCSRKLIYWIIGILLIGYSLILLLCNGLILSEENILSVVDRAVLGSNHMYTEWVDGISIKFDPEGLLSTIPSIAHCLIGFLCGGMIMATKNNENRSYNLFIIGALLTIAGFLLDYGLPINKKLWSPTFVFTTCGLASTLLGLLIWYIDIKGHRRWCKFFEVFGINPLFLYTLSSFLAISLNNIRVPFSGIEAGFINIHSLVYEYFLVPLCFDNTMLASLCYALLFVGINWLIGLWLYKRRIYIKI